MSNRALKPLAITFAIGGIWDTIAGIMHFFFIGTGRLIDNPGIDPYFSIFQGSFFICFAYLQFLSSLNIGKHSLNVGCLILGRVFYVVQLSAFIAFVRGFPSMFLFTGIIDTALVLLYVVFAHRGGLQLRSLFVPST